MPCPETNGRRIDDLWCYEAHVDEQMFKFMELEHQPASVEISLLRLYAVCMYSADRVPFLGARDAQTAKETRCLAWLATRLELRPGWG